jgi:Peptidase A4 family
MTMRSPLRQLRARGARARGACPHPRDARLRRCGARARLRFIARTAPELAIATAAAAALALPGAAFAAQSDAVSSNWSGYAVTNASRSARFDRVAGSWSQPAGHCEVGQETYSVAWVGLGGFKHGAKALEQAGTAVDCTQSGEAVYSAWYELVPASPVTLRLSIHPGDAIAASVAEQRGKTILQVRNLTTHAAKTKVLTISPLDLSSAEWIVEAPSNCIAGGRCTPLPLTDFGTIPFTKASVSTPGRQRMAIDAKPLNVTRLELRDYAEGRTGEQAEQAASTPATGVASALSAAGDAFTVTWQALSDQSSQAPNELQSGLTSAAASIRR